MRTRAPALTGAAIAAALAATPAVAHPHVWVSSTAQLAIEDGAVAAIEQTWTFDEYYTAMAIQGLDTNEDGRYTAEELSELAQINMEGLKEFAYFTYGQTGETPLAFGTPRNARLEYTGGVLSLHFRLPLAEPVPTTTPGLAFATFDPSFFVAFQLAGDAPVTLGGGGSTPCRVRLTDGQQVENAAADANQTLTGAFAEQFGSASVVTMKWATLTCPGMPTTPAPRLTLATPAAAVVDVAPASPSPAAATVPPPPVDGPVPADAPQARTPDPPPGAAAPDPVTTATAPKPPQITVVAPPPAEMNRPVAAWIGVGVLGALGLGLLAGLGYAVSRGLRS
jgi:ABC-type uncharacterized transport system substrate-binding protein